MDRAEAGATARVDARHRSCLYRVGADHAVAGHCRPLWQLAAALAVTVGLSLVGLCWGGVFGALLPFVLRAVRLDLASASAPFVATMVDVSGLLIYFTVARVVLRGVLL